MSPRPALKTLCPPDTHTQMSPLPPVTELCGCLASTSDLLSLMNQQHWHILSFPVSPILACHPASQWAWKGRHSHIFGPSPRVSHHRPLARQVGALWNWKVEKERHKGWKQFPCATPVPDLWSPLWGVPFFGNGSPRFKALGGERTPPWPLRQIHWRAQRPLLMPKQSLSMRHLNQSWVLLPPPSTGKLLRAKPANQRREKPALAMRIKSREENCSFKSVLEVCFTLSLRKKRKTWKLKVNIYFQEKCYVIKWYILITGGGYFVTQEITGRGHCALTKLYLLWITSPHPAPCAPFTAAAQAQRWARGRREVLRVPSGSCGLCSSPRGHGSWTSEHHLASALESNTRLRRFPLWPFGAVFCQNTCARLWEQA